MMNDVYEKFLKSSEEFIFAENKPEKSDIIFVPGNGYPQMAEKAAELFKYLSVYHNRQLPGRQIGILLYLSLFLSYL